MAAPLGQYHGAFPPNARLPAVYQDEKLARQHDRVMEVRPSQQQQAKQATLPSRPLRVSEALQFTPLTSILPHDAAVISMPNASASMSHPIFANSKDRQRARDHLLHIDQQIKQDHEAPVRETLGTMQSLLDPSMISQYTFKKAPTGPRSKGEFKPANHLSPFARMVLNHTGVEYVYPEPSAVSTPASGPKPGSVQSITPAEPPTPLTPEFGVENDSALRSYGTKVEANMGIEKESQINRHSSPHKPIAQPISSGTKPLIQDSERKRKRVDIDNDRDDPQVTANADLQSLKELIWEINAAEDNFSSNDQAGLLTTVHGPEGDIATLSSGCHMKLDPAIAHVIKAKKLHVLDVESLVKLQNLSAGAISAADGLDAQFSSDWNDTIADDWHTDIEIIEAAFRASRTVLRIMCGGREEKVLYPEELLEKIINLVCKAIDNCITKVIEARSTGETSDLFRIAGENKKQVAHLLQSSSKILKLLLEVIQREELSEKPINDILFFAIRILFVENSPSEKDSVLGVQKFETFRRTAMNLITMIYSRYEDQRDFTLREILDSLQKLPTTKVHARQYKLADGSRLQLTSVLLVRLVSTSGSGGISSIKHKSRRALPEFNASVQQQVAEVGDSDASDDEAVSDEEEDKDGKSSPAKGLVPRPSSIAVSQQNAKDLSNAAWMAAQKITHHLVTRASTCSKTGEEPHRHLLDMFVEDLLVVFNSPEWPATEIILRALVTKMIELGDSSSAVSAKNMALETLGNVSIAILGTQNLARQFSKALDTDESLLAQKLSNLLECHGSDGLTQWDLADNEGPYHVVLDALAKEESDVQGYHLMQWAKMIFWEFKNTNQPPEALNEAHSSITTVVCDAFLGGTWPSSLKAVSQTQCKLAYQLILLNVGVCKAFTRILNVLIGAVKSDQVTVRAKAIRSVTQMIEKEPSMLDRMADHVNALIVRCANDTSSMVRDSALALLGKCMAEKSALDGNLLRSVLVYTRDSAAGIKKRAIKLLRDIFLRDFGSIDASAKDYKTIISEYLLQTAVDPEEGVTELGRQTIEEMWLAPFEKMSKKTETSVQERVALKTHMLLLSNTMNRSEAAAVLARRFLRYSMSAKCKNSNTNKNINKAFVAAGFDGMLDEAPDAPSRLSILQTLTVFAQASPRLFTQQQLEHLFQPYKDTIVEASDVNPFRKVVIILRWVLPTLSSIQENFLTQVQAAFMKNLTRLSKQLLSEVAACLWTINGTIQNVGTLANVEFSVLQKLRQMETVNFEDKPAEAGKATRFMDLAGQFGHFCDFSSKHADFKAKFNWLSQPTVPGMIIAALRPFTTAKKPLTIRTCALENLGLICEAWPQHFNDPDNVTMFQEILRGDHPDLQKIILGCFRNFFATQDAAFGNEDEIEEREVLIDGKIGGSVIASEKDAAAALIAQGFVKDILRISLSSQDDYALAATEVLTSILRQGLVHPKDAAPGLVALETSTNARIAQLAYQQHETLHTQHESMFDREYARAITEAFRYQRDVVKDSRGFVKSTYRAKLHQTYEVIKTSKSKVQAKFFTNYLLKIDFDPAKLDITGSDLPPHLEQARFLLENLAFFDYVRLDDLMQIINGCDKIVASTGSAVADSINRDVFGMVIDPTTGIPLNLTTEGEDVPASSQVAIPDARLRLLTTSAVILMLTYEVRKYLRKLHNITSTQANGQPGRTGRGRPTKDTSKLGAKNANVTGDSLIVGIDRAVLALESREASIEMCRKFSDHMAVDSEVKVPLGDEDDQAADQDANGSVDSPTWNDREMSMASNEDAFSANGSIRKRRGSSIDGGTPKKRRGRPPKNKMNENRKRSVSRNGFESVMFG